MCALFPSSQSLPKIINLQRVVATYNVCIVTISPTITGRHIIPDIFISRPSACTILKSAGFKFLHLNPKSNKSFCLIIDMDAPVSNNALTFVFFSLSLLHKLSRCPDQIIHNLFPSRCPSPMFPWTLPTSLLPLKYIPFWGTPSAFDPAVHTPSTPVVLGQEEAFSIPSHEGGLSNDSPSSHSLLGPKQQEESLPTLF